MELRRSDRKRKQRYPNISQRGAPNRVDWFSYLPEPIISIILSFLPTKNAVATSVLSKSWKLRWTQVTSFEADEGLFIGNYCARGVREMLKQMAFVRFIDMIKENQTADSPNHIRLGCEYPGRRMRYGCYEMKLPGDFYTCEFLKVLKLAGPVFIDPGRVCLPKLVVLELNSVIYRGNGVIRNLISGCPMLHSLKIERIFKIDYMEVCTISSPTLKHLEICFNFDPHFPYWKLGMSESYLSIRKFEKVELEIDAPALEYLNLNDSISEKISIRGLTSVREVDLDLSRRAGSGDNMVVGLVQSLDCAKFMKLGESVVQALILADNKLSGTFERLTKLVVVYGSSLHWSCLVGLIDHFVKLEVIETAFYRSKKSKVGSYSKATYRRSPVRVPTCLSSSLKQVTIKGFDNQKGLMAMLKFILEHGLVMERVDLCFDDDEERYSLLKKILMLSRASPACKIQVINAS